MSAPKRRKSRLIQIISVLLLGAGFASAAPMSSLRADVTLLGQDPAASGVRTVVAELLAREGFALSWSAGEGFRPQDLLDRRGEAGVGAIGVWIDLSSQAEARLYFRDSRADRFFIRSLPLGQGIDEIAKEEIGVHYNVQSSSGASTRVLAPMAIRPGVSLGMALVF